MRKHLSLCRLGRTEGSTGTLQTLLSNSTYLSCGIFTSSETAQLFKSECLLQIKEDENIFYHPNFEIRAWSGCNSPWGSDSRITPDSHSITRVVDATHSSAMIIFIFMFNWSSDREIFVKRENIVVDLATKVNWQWQTEHMQRQHQT